MECISVIIAVAIVGRQMLRHGSVSAFSLAHKRRALLQQPAEQTVPPQLAARQQLNKYRKQTRGVYFEKFKNLDELHGTQGPFASTNGIPCIFSKASRWTPGKAKKVFEKDKKQFKNFETNGKAIFF